MRTFTLILPLALLLVSCGGGGPTGTYELDVEDMTQKSIDLAMSKMPAMVKNNMPPAQKETMEKMAKENAAKVKIQVELKGDNTFTASSNFNDKNESASGNWELNGDKIKFTTTHENGEKKSTSEIAEGTFKDGVIEIKFTKDMPFSVILRKK